MKYIYKKAGIVVESKIKLDSALFQSAEEATPPKAADKAKKTASAKK